MDIDKTAQIKIDVQLHKLYHAELARLEENNQPLITYDEWFDAKPWIYESPDKGNIIYRRKFGTLVRERVR